MSTPPGYGRVSLEFTQATLTRPAYITYGVDSTDTDPVAVAAQQLAAFAAAGSLNTIVDSTVVMTGVHVSLGTDGGEDNIYSLATTTAGAGGTMSSLPPNCAVLVHKVTGRGGRRGRGRLFLPWTITETNVDEAGIVTPSQVTAITAACTSWRIALSSGGNPMVLLHSPGKTATGPPDVVTSLIADRLIATQRRRLGR